MNIDQVEQEVRRRLKHHEGETFQQVRGQRFTYTLKGETLVPSTTEWNIAPSQVRKALEFMPVRTVSELSGLQAPSYLFALLMDPRIRQGLY
ncbi:hypothetical protein [Deinococcus cellulosilyticus]|uniref:Uncharacterized protein n=1 Tax=Deinococcus cellulosilyticus (strain DSM 18568 / NBRC 106333 / KACC 11606 / 5516J-15) TaxID=1223518 RepID=A0A511NAE0_DEIC1|nr:hypothetical protein [Deinococcus cellulosilyticus]GEM49783.1 hypothetical protein DC3_54180 [Deinococcus cellulosilyticus NBRC 106333 = KACC 11606]